MRSASIRWRSACCNYAEQDPHASKPWSTRQLREAFAAGAEALRLGAAQPRAALDARRQPADRLGRGRRDLSGRRTAGEAMVRILADGSVEVVSSAIDMGQGTYTILAQTAAEALGVPVEQSWCKLGDSALPRAPVAGGSQLANLMTGGRPQGGARRARRADRARASTIRTRRSARCRPTRLPSPTAGSPRRAATDRSSRSPN